MEYTTSEKGNIGESAFCLWCAKNKYDYGKSTEKSTYDFFLDRRDGKILRVQVKYRTPDKNDSISIKLKPTDKKNNNYFDYTNGSIDAIAIYNSITAEIAFIPIEDIPKDQSYFFLLCRDSKNGKEDKQSRLFSNYLT